MSFPGGGWLRQQKITIAHTQVAGDQTNFPVLLIWTGSAGTSNVDSDIVNSSNSWSANADGSDIRCSADAAGATQYPVEIANITVSTNTANARLEMYVNVTSVSSSTDTVFYLWYGNDNANMPLATDTYGSQAVWTNHLGVWHMDAASGNEPDSTVNAYTAVNTGSTVVSTGLYGGNARAFSGAGQYFTITGLLGSPATVTLLGICYNTSTTTDGEIITVGNCAGARSTYLYGSYGFYQQVGGGFVNCAAGTPPIANVWEQYTFSCSPAVSHEISYANTTVTGNPIASATAILYTGQGANTIIGKHGTTATTYFTGNMEEVRALSVYTPQAWVTTTYNNLLSANTFAATSNTSNVSYYSFPNGWTRKAKLTIDHTKVPADQANFPVLLNWNGTTGNLPIDIYNNGPNSPNSSANGNGADIRATTDEFGRNLVPIEIVTLNANSTISSASAEIYVKLPSVSSTVDTVFYLWWRCFWASALPATDTNGSQAVWSNNYAGVWHMNAASGNEADSTANAYTAVNTGSTTTTGKFGSTARSFDGTGNTYFTVTGLLGSPAACTMLAIVNVTAIGSAGASIVSLGDHVSLQVLVTPSENAGVYYNGATWPISAETPAVTGSGYVDMAFSCSPAASSEIVYVGTTAGTNIASATGISYAGLGANTVIGKHANGGTTYNLTGAVEEIRILNIIQNSSWVTATYNNLMSPSTFVSVTWVQDVQVIKYDQGAEVAQWIVSTATVSASMTIGNGTNRALLVGISYRYGNGLGTTVTGVTFNGLAMDQIVTTNYVGSSNTQGNYIWWMPEANLPVGGTYTCTVTFANANAAVGILGYLALWNVNQGFVNTGSNTGTNLSTISAPITTTIQNSWIIDNLSVGGGTGDPTVDSTTGHESWTYTYAATNFAAGMSYGPVPGPIATNSTWSLSLGTIQRITLVNTTFQPYDGFQTTAFLDIGSATWYYVIHAYVLVSGVWKEFQVCVTDISHQWT
jgi:hypothetical protein